MTAAEWPGRVLAVLDAGTGDLVGDLVDLVRIPSVSGSAAENEIQHALARQLAGLGLEVDLWPLPLGELIAEPGFPGSEVSRTEAWGLVARRPARAGGPSLMLNAHVDVVPPGHLEAWAQADPFSGLAGDGRVRGRGACDMKGGLVAALGAVRALQISRVPLRGDLLLACVVGEEDGGLGTYATLRRGWRADACVIPEPTGLAVMPAAAGALTFRLRVPGRATHASRRTEGVSAIEKFWPVFRALAELERTRNERVDPLFARWRPAYPLSIGRLQAGDWASSVPDLLVAEGRLGVMLDEPVEQARADLEACVAATAAGDPWLAEHPVTVEWWGGQFASGRLPAGSDLIQRVSRAHRAATAGARPEVCGAPYGSDLRLMAGLGGVPTLHYGPGDARLAHAPDESVSVAEVATAARTLALLALDWCGVG